MKFRSPWFVIFTSLFFFKAISALNFESGMLTEAQTKSLKSIFLTWNDRKDISTDPVVKAGALLTVKQNENFYDQLRKYTFDKLYFEQIGEDAIFIFCNDKYSLRCLKTNQSDQQNINVTMWLVVPTEQNFDTLVYFDNVSIGNTPHQITSDGTWWKEQAFVDIKRKPEPHEFDPCAYQDVRDRFALFFNLTVAELSHCFSANNGDEISTMRRRLAIRYSNAKSKIETMLNLMISGEMSTWQWNMVNENFMPISLNRVYRLPFRWTDFSGIGFVVSKYIQIFLYHDGELNSADNSLFREHEIVLPESDGDALNAKFTNFSFATQSTMGCLSGIGCCLIIGGTPYIWFDSIRMSRT